MRKILFLICGSLLPLLVFAQLGISGDVTPSSMLRISDASLINLPFRLADFTLDYALGDVEFTGHASVETRWQESDISRTELQLREAYLIWYPSFGEVKLGKIIHAWGTADANNPTDNLSPYDYYYMFLSGTDRKIGNLSASMTAYVWDMKLSVVVIPEFVANRIPYGEPDFPIKIELPAGAEIHEPSEPLEYGGRALYAMGLGDISLSYFKGFDRSVSPIGIRIPSSATPFPVPQLGYRQTSVMGMDFVMFPGNWTLRGEMGYFQTETPDIELDIAKLHIKNSYLQYILQLEYAFANGVQVMGQFIHTNYDKGETTFTPNSAFSSLPVAMQSGITTQFQNLEFQAGMGTPFALISEKVFILSSMATFLDNSLELSGMGLINLEETGYMMSVGAEYSLWGGFKTISRAAYFIGGDETGNIFTAMEDFSNVTLGLEFNF